MEKEKEFWRMLKNLEEFEKGNWRTCWRNSGTPWKAWNGVKTDENRASEHENPSRRSCAFLLQKPPPGQCHKVCTLKNWNQSIRSQDMIIHIYHHFPPFNGNPQNSVDHGSHPIGASDDNTYFETYTRNPCALIIDLKGIEKATNKASRIRNLRLLT